MAKKRSRAKEKTAVAVQAKIFDVRPALLDSSSSHAIVAAENIALLDFLHTVPEKPLRNKRPTPSKRRCDAAYSLPFEKERVVCGSFAFLASVRDDQNRIPAVCLEEFSDKKTLKILVAVNEDQAGQGKPALEQIKSGFDAILAILRRVKDDTSCNSGIEMDVFVAIVGMCSERILSRLRYRQRWKSCKKKSLFKDKLQEVIQHLRENKLENHHLHRSAAEFSKWAKLTNQSLAAWENHQVTESLQAVVEDMYHLSQVPDLLSVADFVLEDSSSKSLVNTIRKVGRYREVARQLYRAAKKFPILRNATVHPVSLGSEACARAFSASYVPDIRSALAARPNIKDAHKTLDSICRHLSKGFGKNVNIITEAEAADSFRSRALKTVTEGKIHAEIQLLYYCLDNPSVSPPRVVCSSKDACFLCNAFITMHDAFHTPGCHGRLYPGWRLPSTHAGLTKRFNHVLEKRLQKSLYTLEESQERTSYPPPNESTLLTMTGSRTTLASTPQVLSEVSGFSSDDDDDNEAEGPASAYVLEKTAPDEASLLQEKRLHTPILQVERLAEGVDAMGEAAGTASPIQLQDPTVPQLKQTTSVFSSLGSVQSEFCSTSGHLAVGDTTELYTQGLLGIQIENVASSDSSGSPSRGLDFRIRWLTDEEAESVRNDPALYIVEVLSFEEEVSYSLSNRDRSIYISHAGQVAHIRLS